MNRERVPNRWRWETLADIGEIYSGGTPKRDNPKYFGGEIPWLRLKDAKSFYVSDSEEKITQKGLKNSSAQLLPEGSVILSTRATLGEVCISETELATNQGFKSVKPAEDLPEYIAYYLKFIEDELEQMGRTTTYPEINKSQFSSISIPLPPVNEQNEIIKKLQKIFREVDRAKESHNRLNEISQSLFQSLVSSLIDDSRELGSTEDRTISEVCSEIKNGGTPKRSEDKYWGGNIPWLRSGEINNGRLDKAKESINQLALDESSAKLFRKDTVLVAMYGDGNTRGRTSIIDREMSANQAVCGLYSNTDICIPEYLWFAVMSLRKTLRQKSRGGNQANLNQGMIKEETIPVPPMQAQEEIVSTLETWRKYVREIQISNDRRQEILDILPKSVLRTAFTGELIDIDGSLLEIRQGGNEQAVLEQFQDP